MTQAVTLATPPDTKPAARPVHQQQWPPGSAPLVSVLITSYNHECFIGPCLDGVLAQVTDFPLEVIVHDDASTDASATVIADYARRFPQVVRAVLQRENQVSKGRKVKALLLGMARGKYIAHCDGDDVWLNPAKLATQVAFLEASPEHVLSFHDAVHVDADGRVIQQANLNERARRDYTQAELRTLKWGWMLLGTMVHRNTGLVLPPEYALVRNSDNFLPMLLAEHGGAKFQPEAGPLAYRQHAGGIWSGKGAAEQARMHLQSYLQIAAYFVRTGETASALAILNGRLKKHVLSYRRHHTPSEGMAFWRRGRS